MTWNMESPNNKPSYQKEPMTDQEMKECLLCLLEEEELEKYFGIEPEDEHHYFCDEGHHDFFDRKLNPYAPGTKSAAAWNEGFTSAACEVKECPDLLEYEADMRDLYLFMDDPYTSYYRISQDEVAEMLGLKKKWGPFLTAPNMKDHCPIDCLSPYFQG